MGEGPQIEFRGSQRFELVKLLGRGATGVVYEVLDREQGLHLALKVLAQRSSTAIALFKNEFRALQGIRHRNLVKLNELLFDQGHWLLTMELVAGVEIVAYARGADALASPESAVLERASPADQTLRTDAPAGRRVPASCQRGGVYVESRVRSAFTQLAEGLNALHAANMIHRDLKPSNVLVDAHGRVVILDFGLATDLGATGSVEHNCLLGTPRYMAPEQAALKSVNRASDWYSAGVMLHEALTGETPIAGSLALAGAESFPESSRVESSTKVATELRDLCVELLAHNPSDRPSGDSVISRIAGLSAPREVESASFASVSNSIFVGRERELEMLHAALKRVCNGEPLTVLVEAESGLGKTSLVQYFVEQVRARDDTALCFWGRCYERESVPYKALDGVMDAVCAHLSALPEADLSRLLPDNAAVIAQAFPGLQLIVRALGGSDDARETSDPHLHRQRIFGAVRELFGRLGSARPLVIVIDDMQWSDIDSLVLLSALLHPPAAPNMLLIAIARPEGALARLALEGAERLRLGPLSFDESQALVDCLLQTPERAGARDADVRRLVDEAKGHPLFLREIVRRRASSANRRGAPVRLDEAIWSRVEALDQATRDVLELTSIAGGPVAQATVANALLVGRGRPAHDLLANDRLGAVLPGGTGTTSERIADLRHAGLIRTTGSHPRDTIEPYHDRVREAVLAHLDPERKRRRHLWLARALEQLEPSDSEALTTHFNEAGERERAYFYAPLAAEKAASALAFDHAAQLYRLALDLAPDDPVARRRLGWTLGDSLANAGRGLAAADCYETAAQGEETLESLELRRLAAAQLLRSGYIERGIQSISQVLARMGIVLRRSRALALLSIGLLRAKLRWRGFVPRLRSHDEVPALQLARIDGTWAGAICLTMFDMLRSAELQCQNALLSLKCGTPIQVLRAYTAEALFLSRSSAVKQPRAVRLLRSASELAEQVGTPEARAWVALCAGAIAFFCGDWLQGEAQCSQAEAVFQKRAGAVFELTTARVFRVWSSVMRGEFREVFRLVPQYVQEAEERGDLYSATYHMTGIGNLAWLSRDDVSGARRRLALVEERWPSKRFNVPLFLNLQAAAHIELYDGRGRTAYQRVLRDWTALRWGFGFGVQMARSGARFARGLAALAAFDERAESTLLRDAAACARGISRERQPWVTCFSEMLLSGVAARQDNDELALAHLAAAEDLASRSGLDMTAVAVRYRRGELIGGDTGRFLVEQSLAQLRAQEIRRPERMLAIFCPPVRVR